ncbi:phytanoyl-CoA dioxygenase family protein [Naematelia encephala]|uniref:Phytanoyl-CoA dioxygenase family protein n=1 Tax=Naematelia encephala TaxID=71784 RepID=A0A1Y2ATW8_9TREE|nr:phytanoyl-CoA dioxygenase family protein [Naematelia encephala]
MVNAKPTIAACTVPNTASIDEIFDVLTTYGGVLIKGLLDTKDVSQILSDVRPYLDAQAPDVRPDSEWDGDFFPSTTRKIGGLLTKSDTFAYKVALNPVILEIADKCFLQRTKMRFGDEEKWCTAKPQINLASMLEIQPGTKAQSLHRDDYNFQRVLPFADKWYKGRDASSLAFVPLAPVTPRNGGTYFIPGSHLWGEEAEPQYEDCIRLEADPGDVFILLSSIFHAGGDNVCEPGEPNSVRPIASVGFTYGFHRQEENQYLALDHAKVRKWPQKLQELAGWNLALPMSGWVGFDHPLKTLGRDVPGGDAMFYDADQSD